MASARGSGSGFSSLSLCRFNVALLSRSIPFQNLHAHQRRMRIAPLLVCLLANHGCLHIIWVSWYVWMKMLLSHFVNITVFLRFLSVCWYAASCARLVVLLAARYRSLVPTLEAIPIYCITPEIAF